MIVTKLHGGLGNQMFQYAFGRALAAKLHTDLKLDVSFYTERKRPEELKDFWRSFKLSNFQIKAQLATDADLAGTRDRWRHGRIRRLVRGVASRVMPGRTFGYKLNMSLQYDPAWTSLPDDTYVEGYWQSPNYFAGVEADLHREFQFVDPELPKFGRAYLDERGRGKRPIIAAHVRRGDLAVGANAGGARITHGPPVEPGYVHEAMKRFEPESLFLVFSDSARDLDWCRENLYAPNIDFAAGHNDLQDFAIMQQCDHFIMSNSTFSWWAAWICQNPDKRVIAPRNWFYPDVAPPAALNDLIPSSWIFVE
jgi:hypothetical protein